MITQKISPLLPVRLRLLPARPSLDYLHPSICATIIIAEPVTHGGILEIDTGVMTLVKQRTHHVSATREAGDQYTQRTSWPHAGPSQRIIVAASPVSPQIHIARRRVSESAGGVAKMCVITVCSEGPLERVEEVPGGG